MMMMNQDMISKVPSYNQTMLHNPGNWLCRAKRFVLSWTCPCFTGLWRIYKKNICPVDPSRPQKLEKKSCLDKSERWIAPTKYTTFWWIVSAKIPTIYIYKLKNGSRLLTKDLGLRTSHRKSKRETMTCRYLAHYNLSSFTFTAAPKSTHQSYTGISYKMWKG